MLRALLGEQKDGCVLNLVRDQLQVDARGLFPDPQRSWRCDGVMEV